MLKMTRAQLYGVAPTSPLTDIARHFGIRGIQIAKACDAYNIARPQPGHWQKIRHGKRSKRWPLETFAHPAEQTIVIKALGWTAEEDLADGHAERRCVA
jgi:hypothetical protein